MASKALLISIAISSVLLCGLLLLKPSVMSCVSFVSSVFVECCGLNPCWLGDSGMSGVIMLSMRRSMTLKAVLSSVMGLYDDARVASLLGFSMAMMMPCFHVLAILHCE